MQQTETVSDYQVMLQQIRDLRVDVPEGEVGSCKIVKFTITKEEADFENMRSVFSFGGGGRDLKPGTYTRLHINGELAMSDTPSEIREFSHFIKRASGKVLINGLGLGVVLKGLFLINKVGEITVIEKSPEVIKLVAYHYKKTCPENIKLTIIREDAFTYNPPKGVKYNCVWHDIWNNICADNLKDITKLHKKYGKRTLWQDSWCKERCKNLR